MAAIGAGTPLVDEKLKNYSAIQAGLNMAFSLSNFYSYSQNDNLPDIQKLFVQKQQILSQFNENTLVKGVRIQKYIVSNLN